MQPSDYPPPGAYPSAYYSQPLPSPDHPGAVRSFVIGIIALVGGMSCYLPILLGPWALIKGGRTMREIDASQGRLGGRGLAVAGFVCGVIATVLLTLAVIVAFYSLVFHLFFA